jgi:hypothetical protein
MKVEEIVEKRILISPLNWGFGHVSRCIPLISKLLMQKNNIYIACDNQQKDIFQFYFSDSLITYLFNEGYPFQFSGNGNFSWDVFLSLRKLAHRSRLELKEVEQFVAKYRIDIVISDHRYAFRSKKCTSIFMTHQLNLPIRWFQFPFNYHHKNQIKKYDFIWLVDDESKNLAGKLSRIKNQKNATYIGALSRFQLYENLVKKTDSVLIVSGPKEYWKSLFELFNKELVSGDINKIIGPKEAQQFLVNSKNFSVFISSENWKEVDKILLNAKKIYGYIGYTTVMDVEELGCESRLVPCPGQLEQIYLATK